MDAKNGSGSNDINDLRDGEIERLLGDNARLNERIIFLLKVIEREHASNVEFAAVQAALETERCALLSDVERAWSPVGLSFLADRQRGHETARAKGIDRCWTFKVSPRRHSGPSRSSMLRNGRKNEAFRLILADKG